MDNNASTSGDPDWRTHESRRLPSKLVECFAVSPDGTQLIYGTPGQITISNLQTQSHTHTVLMEKGRVDSMAFSSDGKGVVVGARLASTSSWKSREGHGVMVLDVDEVSFRMKSKMVPKSGRSQPPVRFVTFATQSQQIISVAGSAITLWDACSGKSIRSFNETTFLQRKAIPITAFDCSNDGSFFAFSLRDLSIIHIQHLSPDTPSVQLQHPSTQGVSTLAISPDGSRVATGSSGVVSIWDLQTKEILLRVLTTANPRSISFSSPGNLIAVGCNDGQINIWDAHHEKPSPNVISSDDISTISRLAFLPGGHGIVSLNTKGVLKDHRSSNSSSMNPNSFRVAQSMNYFHRRPLYPTSIDQVLGAQYDPLCQDSSNDQWTRFIPSRGGKSGKYMILHNHEESKKGGFGDVLCCDVKFNDGKVEKAALKQLRPVGILTGPKDAETLFRMLRRLEDEIIVWSALEHPHVAPLLGFRFRPQMHLISPWYKHGTVKSYLGNHPNADRLKLMSQAADGFQYLHSLDPPVIHGDINASNLLVDDNGNILINDFGLSQVLEMMPAQELSRTIQGAGSNRYKAPELLSEDLDVKERSKPTDVYAFGGTIFEIATDHVPYYGLNERKLNDILSQGLLPSDLRQNYSHRLRSDDPLWDLMNECWDVQPEKRPTMLQIKDRLGTLAKGN